MFRALARGSAKAPTVSAFGGRLFIGVALVMLALAPAQNIDSDGTSMLVLTESILRGHFTVPCSAGVHGSGGSCFSNFYLLQSLLLIPFVALGHLAGTIAGTRPTFVGRFAAMAFPALCTAGAATFAAALARERGASHRRATAAAVAIALGTQALTYSRTLFAEPLGELCVALTVWGLVGRSRRRQLWGAAGSLLCAMTKPQLVLVGPLVGLALAVRDRSWRPLLRGCGGTLCGGLLYLSYNLLRFGDPLNFGLGRDLPLTRHGFSLPANIAHSTADLLLSPNQGLLFFSPLAIVGMIAAARARDRIAAACLAGAFGVLALYTTQPNGAAWGPRYLTPLVPIACVGLTSLSRRWAVAAALVGALTLASQLPNVAAYYQRAFVVGRWTPARLNVQAPPSWDWDRPELVDVWPAALDELRQASHTDVRVLARSAGRPGGKLLETVALWWADLPIAGIPAWVGALLMGALLIVGARLVGRAASVGDTLAARPVTSEAARAGGL
jgi:hypothetical protein